MPIFLIFIVIKIALVLFGAVLGAMFAVEFLPQMADWALATSSGTAVEEVAQWVAKGLHFLAAIAQKFLNFMSHMLAYIGIDMSGLEKAVEEVDVKNPTPPKIDKPEF